MINYQERIREERELQGITQKEMANRIGTSFQYYSKLETGRHIMTIERAIEICRILNISLDYIVGFTNEIKRIK